MLTYRAILSTAGITPYDPARQSLKHNGRYLSTEASFSLFFWVLLTSFFGSSRAHYAIATGSSKEMLDIRDLLKERAIWPAIAERFPLQQIVKAFSSVEAGGSNGCVVLDLSSSR